MQYEGNIVSVVSIMVSTDVHVFQIATPDCVYIFDMLWIGELALIQGLGEILESGKVLKVGFLLVLTYFAITLELVRSCSHKHPDLLIWDNAGGEREQCWLN